MLYGDSGYLGIGKKVDNAEFEINRKPSTLKTFLKGGGFNADRDEEGASRLSAARRSASSSLQRGTSGMRRRGVAALPKTRKQLYSSFLARELLKRARAGRGEEFCSRRSLPFCLDGGQKRR